MDVCLYVCLCVTCVQCPWRPEESGRSPKTGVSCHVVWELILGPLQEQQVLLITGIPLIPIYRTMQGYISLNLRFHGIYIL